MKLLLRALPGDRIDGALIVALIIYGGGHRVWDYKIILRISLHYALVVRVVPAWSDLRRQSWLARWLRLQFRLLWFPAGAPFVSRATAETLGLRTEDQVLQVFPVRHELVPDLELDGWYVRCRPWWRR